MPTSEHITTIQIILLAIVQGLAELLPVSSSAHVVVMEKLMHIKPDSPEATLLLVMLHTGTMFAVILYFWKRWKSAFFATKRQTIQAAQTIIIATAITGVIGLGMKLGIEHVLKHRHPEAPKAEVEQLFSHLELIGGGLAAAGILILVSGLPILRRGNRTNIDNTDAGSIGAIQGFCLPFRGFSRSGSTISVGLLRGISRATAEDFSFALAVVLTPVVIVMEGKRLLAHHAADAATNAAVQPLTAHDFVPCLIGMVASFIAGLLALSILSKVLESGKWWVFGVYCLVASGVVFYLYSTGL